MSEQGGENIRAIDGFAQTTFKLDDQRLISRICLHIQMTKPYPYLSECTKLPDLVLVRRFKFVHLDRCCRYLLRVNSLNIKGHPYEPKTALVRCCLFRAHA